MPIELNNNNDNNNDEIKKIVEENLKLTQEIHKMTKYIKSYIIWSQVFGVLKLIIIIIPIVLGLMYLPPLLKGVMEQYQQTVGPLKGVKVDNIPPYYQNLIK